ncbi:Hypothetical protein A7982_09339 [Minicystis rosea]|nr:Hypothetical protein A7982_09339 [Minicystis rosea]
MPDAREGHHREHIRCASAKVIDGARADLIERAPDARASSSVRLMRGRHRRCARGASALEHRKRAQA